MVRRGGPAPDTETPKGQARVTDVPALLDRGEGSPEARSGLVAALLVVLGAMRDQGMLGPVVTLLDGPLPPDAPVTRAELTPPETAALGPLADEARASLGAG